MLGVLHHRGRDALEMRGEHHVGDAALLDQLAFRVGAPARGVQGPADDDLVARAPERVELLGRAAGAGGDDGQPPSGHGVGFLQITFRSAGRLSSRTIRSAWRIMSGSFAPSSTRSAQLPHARAMPS